MGVPGVDRGLDQPDARSDTTEGSPLTASIFRDIKAGQPIEADHVIGDLIARADTAKIPVPRPRTAYTHLKAYEQTRG